MPEHNNSQFCTHCGRSIPAGSPVCDFCNHTQPDLNATITNINNMKFFDWVFVVLLLLIPIINIFILHYFSYGPNCKDNIIRKNWSTATMNITLIFYIIIALILLPSIIIFIQEIILYF